MRWGGVFYVAQNTSRLFQILVRHWLQRHTDSYHMSVAFQHGLILIIGSISRQFFKCYFVTRETRHDTNVQMRGHVDETIRFSPRCNVFLFIFHVSLETEFRSTWTTRLDWTVIKHCANRTGMSVCIRFAIDTRARRYYVTSRQVYKSIFPNTPFTKCDVAWDEHVVDNFITKRRQTSRFENRVLTTAWDGRRGKK